MKSLSRLFVFNLRFTKNITPVVSRNFSVKKDDMTEKKIQVGDYQINYLKVGNGPYNLLFMPGALGSIWTDFAPQIKGLNKDLFTLIAWDPPGYGKSIPPEREFPVNFYEKDADTALLLMRALDLQKFSLLGWSDGGISSIFLAAKYPKNVKKAVIWGAKSHILKSELKLYDNVRDINKWSAKMKEPMIAVYGEKYFEETWHKWCDGVKNIYYTNRGDICMSFLEKIECPTLIVHGEKDSMVDPAHTPLLQSNIRNSKLHVYPEGKHNIHLRYADDFNKLVTEFLQP
ncbi:serine hydrolase BPHL [Arctopsyche grandis]|uniref:serine hydrolase BPHL n=1 Tax=Arctopsyche grandis TaxID=121162 RepID=UPI00406D9E27